jgi:hypothetical protein
MQLFIAAYTESRFLRLSQSLTQQMNMNFNQKKSATLNQSAVDAFKRFENEIREVKDSYGFTTVDTYTSISKNWAKKKQMADVPGTVSIF